MTLTMVVNVEHSNVTLKEQHSLVIGNLYDPLRLEFSSGYSPTFQKLKVKLYRPDTGELIAYTTKEFVRDPDTPTVGVGRLNLATTDVKEWTETLDTDSDPATETNGSVQVVVCEVWDDDDKSIVYANCEVPITLTKGVAVPLSGDNEVATKEYVASQIKRALDGLKLECSCPSGGSGSTDEPTVSIKNLLIRGEVTSSKNMPVSFQVEDSDTVVGSGSSETPPDPACVYYDIKTRILYGVSADGASLQTVGPRIFRDVHLMPLGGKPYSLGSMNTDAPVIDFVEQPLNIGYYDPKYDRFFYNTGKAMEALRPDGDRISDAVGILYLDMATWKLYWFDKNKSHPEDSGIADGGYHSIAADVSPEALRNLVTGADVDPSYRLDDQTGFSVPVTETTDESTGGKKLTISGLLDYAVAVGRIDSYGNFWSTLGGLNAEKSLVGDPRRLYIVTKNESGGGVGLFVFNHRDSKYEQYLSSDIDVSGVVKTITGPIGDPCTPDTDGTVDISGIIPTRVVIGEMTEHGFNPGSGNPFIQSGESQTLYIDSKQGALYHWDSNSFVKIPVASVNRKTPVTAVSLNGSQLTPDENGSVDLGSILSKAFVYGKLAQSNSFIDPNGESVEKNTELLYIDAEANIIYRYDSGSGFTPVFSPKGQENTIERIKVNGAEISPDTQKCVDLGTVLSTAIKRGTVADDMTFKHSGESDSVPGSPEYVYLDLNTYQLYVFDGRRLKQAAKPDITAVKVNKKIVEAIDGTVDIGTVISEITVNGSPVSLTQGVANIDVADPGDVRTQVITYKSYDDGKDAYSVYISSYDVSGGASIFVFNYATRSGPITLDISNLVTPILSNRRAYSFEVWLRNTNTNDTLQITRPQTAQVSAADSVPISWLSGDEMTQLNPSSAMYITFRVATGWNQDSRNPIVQASIYHVG